MWSPKNHVFMAMKPFFFPDEKEQIESQTQDKPLEMLTASGSSAAPAEPHRF